MKYVEVTILVPLDDINIEYDMIYDAGCRDYPETFDPNCQIDIDGMDYEIESWDETLVDEKAIEMYKADV